MPLIIHMVWRKIGLWNQRTKRHYHYGSRRSSLQFAPRNERPYGRHRVSSREQFRGAASAFFEKYRLVREPIPAKQRLAGVAKRRLLSG
jgi:hypothetical protein